jgi:hypothetical protein
VKSNCTSVIKEEKDEDEEDDIRLDPIEARQKSRALKDSKRHTGFTWARASGTSYRCLATWTRHWATWTRCLQLEQEWSSA